MKSWGAANPFFQSLRAEGEAIHLQSSRRGAVSEDGLPRRYAPRNDEFGYIFSSADRNDELKVLIAFVDLTFHFLNADMTNIQTFYQVDNVFGNIRGVIPDTLQSTQ